jgi:hypothetical protein
MHGDREAAILLINILIRKETATCTAMGQQAGLVRFNTSAAPAEGTVEKPYP